MKKKFKMVKINDPDALDHIARCEVYQAISDYEIWSRILKKDPSDLDAYYMKEDCEEFLLTDPRVKRCIEDPVWLLCKIDGLVEREYKKWVKNAVNK